MDNRELQRLINKCAAANETYYFAQKALNEYCERRYGAAPSDLDCDDIIDALLGGAGAGNRMTAKAFDKQMKDALARGEQP